MTHLGAQRYIDFEHVQHAETGEEHNINTANNIIVATYLVYVLISVSLTIWVARTLYKRGAFSWSTPFTATPNWPTP